ncbi:hypothetical protein V2J09_002112 [Rumex salicifolius]
MESLASSDLSFTVYFAFFFVAARFFLDKFIFRGIARYLLSKGYTQTKLNEIPHEKVSKCSESMWKLTYYATVQAYVLSITCRESWFLNTNKYFEGWPNQELKLSLKLYYLCQCGFYIYSIAALKLWETRRKDFAVSMSHHIITVILIGYSYTTRLFRIGAVTLALHDASDVFLEAAKVFKYSEHDLAASVCFGLFALSWFILRLVFFPLWVIKASSYEFSNYLEVSKVYHKFMYYLFNTMLLTLLVFHIYWWILIYSMIMRQLKNKGKVGEDIRSAMESFMAAVDASHFSFAIFFAFFFVAARFVLDKFLFHRIARWLLSKGYTQTKLNKIPHEKVLKCSESMWKFTYYASVEASILLIAYHESWFDYTNDYLRGWPNQELKTSVKLYYMCQCGFYLYSIAALQLWETRRKDFSVSMSHHVIAVCLIVYGFKTGIFIIGAVTFALHDASDVFLEAAKVFKYSDHDLAASVFFGLFAISWFILRLIFFPLVVIRTASYDSQKYLDISKWYHRFMYYVFNTLLLTLLVFHIYWWTLIYSMIMRQMKNKGKVGEDIRSDSEDDE